VSPVPVRYARQMGAEVVIAVDISSAPEGNPFGDTLQVLLQTFAIMGKSINSWELKDADVVVRPALTGMGSGDFTGNPAHIEQKAFDKLRHGRKIEVTFVDSEVIVGSTLNYQPDGDGFFVLPADARSNNMRVFVVSGSVRHVRFP